MQIHVPPELEAGVYANQLAIWHTGHEFTLDFFVSLPAQEQRDEHGNVVHLFPGRVTTRVKVPPSVLFDMLRAINDNLTKFETVFGAIKRPGQDEQLVIPDDLLGEVKNSEDDTDVENDDDGDNGPEEQS